MARRPGSSGRRGNARFEQMPRRAAPLPPSPVCNAAADQACRSAAWFRNVGTSPHEFPSTRTTTPGRAVSDGGAFAQLTRTKEIAMIPFRRILVPHDFSDSAAAALKLAATLIPADGGLLVL